MLVIFHVNCDLLEIHELEKDFLEDKDTLLLKFSCLDMFSKQIIGIEVSLHENNENKLFANDNNRTVIFFKSFSCENKRVVYKKVTFRLNNRLKYRPDFMNHRIYDHRYKASITAWMTDYFTYTRLIKLKNINFRTTLKTLFNLAYKKQSLITKLNFPYSRKSRQDENQCFSFSGQILNQLESTKIYQCDLENGKINNIFKLTFLFQFFSFNSFIKILCIKNFCAL